MAQSYVTARAKSCAGTVLPQRETLPSQHSPFPSPHAPRGQTLTVQLALRILLGLFLGVLGLPRLRLIHSLWEEQLLPFTCRQTDQQTSAVNTDAPAADDR